MTKQPRKIKAKGPRFPTWLDQTRSLSQIIAEEVEKEMKEIKKPKKKKEIKFTDCRDCVNWVTTRVEDKKTYGYCKIGIKVCPYL